MLGDILAYIQQHWDDIITAITSLIGAFTIIAKLTPTTADDKVIDFILKVINFLSLNIKPQAKKEAAVEIIQSGAAEPQQAADAVTGVSTEAIIKKAGE